MQSARVWQTQFREGGIAPKEELPSIDYDRVMNSMRQMGASPSVRKSGIDPSGISNIVREAMAPTAPEYRPDASQWLPGQKPQRRLKLASDESVDTSVCESCGIPHPCHHDVDAARNAGDEKAVKAMNEIRNMRRMAFVQAQESAIQAAEEAFVKEASYRENRREAVSQILDEMESRLEAKEKTSAKGGDEKTSEGDGDTKGVEFKPVSALNDSERNRLKKWASKNGWDPEYAEKFFSPIEDGIPEAVKKVASTNLDEASKRGIVIAMLKESKLTSEQANRIKEYWKEELQYQDAEWVDDLVADPDK